MSRLAGVTFPSFPGDVPPSMNFVGQLWPERTSTCKDNEDCVVFQKEEQLSEPFAKTTALFWLQTTLCEFKKHIFAKTENILPLAIARHVMGLDVLVQVLHDPSKQASKPTYRTAPKQGC